jgi:hypothetical protein
MPGRVVLQGLRPEDRPRQSEVLQRVDQGVERNRLDEIRVGTDLEGDVDIVGIGRSGQDDGRDRLLVVLAPNPSQDVEAAAIRQAQIEQDEDRPRESVWIVKRWRSPEVGGRAGGGGGRLYRIGEPRASKHVSQDVGLRRIILDDQDGRKRVIVDRYPPRAGTCDRSTRRRCERTPTGSTSARGTMVQSAAPRTEIVTEHFDARLRPDGVLQISWRPGFTIDAELARAAVAAGEEIAGGTPRRLLVDMRISGQMDRDARALFSAPSEWADAVALWVQSPMSKVIANFFLGLQKPSSPTRLFTEESEALAWLMEQRV